VKLEQAIKRARHFADPFRVDRGHGFRLRDFPPGDTGKLKSDDKEAAKDALAEGIEALGELQEMLYAQDRWAVLLVFQAIDAAGKDGAIKHVMSGINPQGCQVVSFKQPSSEDLDHDYLWRSAKALPERGRIGIFNRSYYEEILVVRVNEGLLEAEHLPDAVRHGGIWKERSHDICNFEEYLAHNGVVVRKFFLHLSKGEQRRRFLDRLENPEKHWKFSSSDLRERERWDPYMNAYEDAIRRTATKHAPWYVVPADNKWFTRLVVAAAIIDALGSLDLHFPRVSAAKRRDLGRAHRQLLKQR
jgi:PPK2 family polyphosphate:nucleotide phosphotransferase